MADAKQGKTSNEDFCNGSSQSRVVLAKPRLGGFGSSGFGSSSSSSKTCNPFGSPVLRPPQLKPGSNPFLKVNEHLEESENKNKTETETTISTEERLNDLKEDAEAPKFVPLGTSNVTPRTANPVPAPAQPPASSSSGFVFGQNLSERVVINENLNNGEASSVDHGSTNGTTELLFTSAAASVKDNVQEEAGPSESRGGSGLAEAAAEYERSHAQPPPPTTNYTTTGEEGEINVLQISCRLFAWESGSWRERGRGVLRLNDAAGGGPPRLVGRAAGSLRVVLNTRLWPDMVVERAAAKSLRITAADAQHQIKLFLIMGAPADITQLHRALIARVAGSKRTNNCAQNVTSQKAAERLSAAEDNDYMDKTNDDAFAHDDESKYDDKQSECTDVADDKIADNNRLEPLPKPDDKATPEVTNEERDSKALKRKEPVEDETSPKRQCPEILIE